MINDARMIFEYFPHKFVLVNHFIPRMKEKKI